MSRTKRKAGPHAEFAPAIGAAARLVSAINNTGGVVQFPDGSIAPQVDPDWIDLGDAYMAACTELGVEPRIQRGTVL